MFSPRFHLAFPVNDLEKTRAFYIDVLGCKPGRSTAQWLDFDFYGHQLSAHLAPTGIPKVSQSLVGGKEVPVPHYGVVLPWDDWEALAERLRGKLAFAIEPHVRFKENMGEQGTMFFYDPSGNALEIKGFKNGESVFAY